MVGESVDNENEDNLVMRNLSIKVSLWGQVYVDKIPSGDQYVTLILLKKIKSLCHPKNNSAVKKIIANCWKKTKNDGQENQYRSKR